METTVGAACRASIEMAWGLRERPHKGPKRELSLDAIVEAASAWPTPRGWPRVSMAG